MHGAEGETRTLTGIHPLDPEPSASTNSATSALIIGPFYTYIHDVVKKNTLEKNTIHGYGDFSAVLLTPGR